MSQLDPIVFNPNLYATGCIVRNNATTPNTKLTITPGVVRDINNVIDMNLGNFQGQGNQAITANSNTVLDATVNGANGLDTGTLAASTPYAVCVIGDSRNLMPTATLLVKSLASGAVLPAGYDSFRIVGAMYTDASAHFILGYWSGFASWRMFMYDAPQATSVTAGNATSYTAVDITSLVAPGGGADNKFNVLIMTALTPSAAGRGVFLRGDGATGDQVVNLGQVTSVVLNSYNWVSATLVAGVSTKINYKVSNASDAVAINVAGYMVGI